MHDVADWQICLTDGALSETDLDALVLVHGALQTGALVEISEGYGRRFPGQRLHVLAHPSGPGNMSELVLCDVLNSRPIG